MIQQKFKEIGIPIPQYIGCQHHVLDLVLKHSMDQILGEKTPFPNLAYDFVQEVSDNYTSLKTDFQQSNVNIKVKNIKW